MQLPQPENLSIRLNSCLELILDLEEQLKKLDLGKDFINELEILRGFMEKVDTVQLNESDVVRIEEATSSFLSELDQPFKLIGRDETKLLRLH